MIRLGLCCIFRKAPITFRRTTAKWLKKLDRKAQLLHLSSLCLHNANALLDSLTFCHQNGIGCFRVNSQILPMKTHPEVGYSIEDLPDFRTIKTTFLTCGHFSRQKNIRLTFHPDQFVLLSSPRESVTINSVAELAYQDEVATWIHADVINIHAGGSYGRKTETLRRLTRRIENLPESIRSRLTLENDDRTYTPADLLPVCRETGVPLVYDVHHHRCHPDGWKVEKATALAMKTWNREPLFHLSSPLNGWGGGNDRQHHDYIDPEDFPSCWKTLPITVEVEAKAKELAVLRFKKTIEQG